VTYAQEWLIVQHANGLLSFHMGMLSERHVPFAGFDFLIMKSYMRNVSAQQHEEEKAHEAI
jgi:hypothetical protein